MLESLQRLMLPPRGSSTPVESTSAANGAVESVVEDVRLAASLRGLALDNVEYLVLVGAGQPAFAEALFDCLPRLRTVVVCEPDVAVLRTFCGAAPRAPSSRRLDAFSTAATDRRGPIAAMLLDVSAVLAQCPLAIQRGLVVADPQRVNADPVALPAVVWALEQLLDPFSIEASRIIEDSQILHSNRGRQAAAAVWAKRLLEDEHGFRALDAYLLLRRVDPRLVAPTKIAMAWQQIHGFERALRWLRSAGLPADQVRDAERDLEMLSRNSQAESAQLLEKNLAHVREHFPELAKALEATTPACVDAVRVTQAPWVYDHRRRNALVAEYPLLVEVDGERVSPLNAPTSARRLHEMYAPLTEPRESHACVGSVSALGSLTAVFRNRVFSTLVNWRQYVYVVERDLSLFRKMLELFDYRWFLQRSRVELHWGEQAHASLIDQFSDNMLRVIPALLERVPDDVKAGLTAVQEQRRHEAMLSFRALETHYTANRHAVVAEKLAVGRPLRVWGFSSLHTSVLQYVVADLLEGFRELGHETLLMIERDASEKVHGYAVLDSLAKFQPDVIVLADHLRPEMGNVFPAELPSMVWILDEMPDLGDKHLIAKLRATDLTFPISHEWSERYASLGYPHVACLPFAANPGRCRVDGPVAASSSVLFATHLCRPNEFAWAPGFLHALAERFDAAALPSWDLDAQRAVIDTVIADSGLSLSPAQCSRLQFQGFLLSRYRDRLAVAEALLDANIPVALYGRGWEEHERMRPFAHGVVEPGPKLGQLYRAHKVVLHINQTCNLHVRVLEALSVSAFVLARSAGPLDHGRSGVASALAIGEELCMFIDVDDMVAKVRRAFSDETWRQSFVNKGRERVLRDHTYRARAETMIAEFRQRMCHVVSVGASHVTSGGNAGTSDDTDAAA